jgi:hypothetical protein
VRALRAPNPCGCEIGAYLQVIFVTSVCWVYGCGCPWGRHLQYWTPSNSSVISRLAFRDGGITAWEAIALICFRFEFVDLRGEGILDLACCSDTHLTGFVLS